MGSSSLKREILGIALALFAVFLAGTLVALAVASGPHGASVQKSVGVVGDFLAGPLVSFFGWPSAVLIPLVNHASGLTVLLTQRTEDMPSHAGQVAFPGGRRDDRDVDAADTALREAEEEVGLARHFVEVVGAIDLYRTGTGYEITPVVGIVTPGFTSHADPREVAEACAYLGGHVDEAKAWGRAGKTVAERVTWDACIDALLS